MTPDQINQFFSFLYEGRLANLTYWLRLIAGITTSALIAAIIVIVAKFRQMNLTNLAAKAQKLEKIPEPSQELAKMPWQDVMTKIESANPSDWNIAVIKADSIFDSVLKDMGLPGETMGERLKLLDAAKLNSLNDVWEAHKLRNRIAHETERVLTQDEARRVVFLFEKALRELQYLQD